MKLSRALKDAQDAADPQLHQRRIAIASEEQRAAVSRYHANLNANLPELLASFRDDAEQAAQDVADAFESIAAIRARRGEVATRVHALISTARSSATSHGHHTISLDESNHWSLPQDETEAPLPSDSTVAYYYPEASAAGVAG